MKVEASTSFILDIEASSDGDGDGDDIDAYREVDEEFFSQNPELAGFAFGDSVLDPFLENDDFVRLG
jgi:hypothetical protein